MPFDDDDDDPQGPNNKGLKQVSSQRSIFDGAPKKPTQEDLDRKVKKIEERVAGYKAKAADLASQFNKFMADKTLPQNRNFYQNSAQTDLLGDMVKLAIEINNDPNEQEGMGSLGWIVLLLRTCFAQRDKINLLEYQLGQLSGKIDATHISALISKEITRQLDEQKKSE